VATSVENDEERKFRISIPSTMQQSLADAHCSSTVQCSNTANIGERKTDENFKLKSDK